MPTEGCCFTGCCDRGKAFLLEQLDGHLDERHDKDDSHEHDSPHS